jgi:hypothetical protein
MGATVETGLVIVGLLLGGAMLYGIAVTWRRVMNDDSPPRLFRILEREGIAPAKLDAGTGEHQLIEAVRRCVLCGAKERCEAALRAASGERYRTFCPNADLIEQAKSR